MLLAENTESSFNLISIGSLITLPSFFKKFTITWYPPCSNFVSSALSIGSGSRVSTNICATNGLFIAANVFLLMLINVPLSLICASIVTGVGSLTSLRNTRHCPSLSSSSSPKSIGSSSSNSPKKSSAMVHLPPLRH